jgi:hypothetical protein
LRSRPSVTGERDMADLSTARVDQFSRGRATLAERDAALRDVSIDKASK